MDLTTLAIAKKFNGNSSSGGSDSKILWFEVTPSNPANVYSTNGTPVTIDISWNDLLEAYDNNFILIPYTYTDDESVYFNLAMTMEEDNNKIMLGFSSVIMMPTTLVFMTLLVAEDSMVMFGQSISNGDGVDY